MQYFSNLLFLFVLLPLPFISLLLTRIAGRTASTCSYFLLTNITFIHNNQEQELYGVEEHTEMHRNVTFIHMIEIPR